MKVSENLTPHTLFALTLFVRFWGTFTISIEMTPPPQLLRHLRVHIMYTEKPVFLRKKRLGSR